MTYFIINNDFHIDNIKKLQYFNKNKSVIIRIPYSLKDECLDLANDIITINTPFRESKKFWNPYYFYKAKKEINQINFTKDDEIILQTEYDPLNQYIVYKAKTQKAKILLLEEGIATYYTFIVSNNEKLNIYEKIKLFYLRYIIGFYYIKFLKLSKKIFCQMEDDFIDEVLLYFNISINRRIDKRIIQFNSFKVDNLNKKVAVFLNQPLYESYLSMNEYIINIKKILYKISKKYEIIYFKFHPRDSIYIKQKLLDMNISNIQYIDNMDLNSFITLYKPMYAYSIFSDSLFKLYHQGLTCIFLYKEIIQLKDNYVITNIDLVLKIINESRLQVEK